MVKIKKNHHLNFCFFLSLFFNNGILAQPDWQLFNTNNSGLHSNYVKDVVVDAKGIIWVACIHNISSYDGKNWNYYPISHSSFSYSSYINDMCLLQDDNLLIGLSGGVCVFNTKTKVADYSLNQQIPFNGVKSVGQNNDGSLWIGESVTGGRVAVYNGSWNSYTLSSTSAVVIYTMENIDNEMWFAVGGTLQRYSNNSFVSYNSGNSPIMFGALIQSLKADEYGKLWVDARLLSGGMQDYRLLTFDGVNWDEYDSLPCIPEGRSIVAIEHLDSTVWFSLEYYGVGEYNYYNGECNFYTQTNSIIPSHHFGRLEIDDNKNVFISTDAGLVVYNKNKIRIDAYKYLEVFAYPNPFIDLVNFRFFSENEQELILQVYNEVGQNIYSNTFQIGAGKIDLPIEISGLSRGLYFFRLKLNNEFYMKKLIKID